MNNYMDDSEFFGSDQPESDNVGGLSDEEFFATANEKKPTEHISESEMFPYAEERGIVGDVGSRLARGGAHALELGGQALKTVGAKKIGQSIVDASKDLEETNFLRPDESEYKGEEGFVEKGIKEGLESAPASLASMVAGGGAGAAVGSFGGPIGTIAGALIGGAAGAFGLYGLGTYGKEKDAALEKGLSKEDSHKYALGQAAVEGGIETIANPIEMSIGLLTGGASKSITQSVKQLIKTPLKKIAKNYLKTAGVEASTEMLQSALGNELAQKYGMSEASTSEQVIGSIIPAITMSLLIGMGGHAYTETRQRRILKDISDQNAAPANRQKAANDIYVGLKKQDPELAEKWMDTAEAAINSNKPIDIDEDFTQYAINEIDKGRGNTPPPRLDEQALTEPIPRTASIKEIRQEYGPKIANEIRKARTTGEEISVQEADNRLIEQEPIEITEPTQEITKDIPVANIRKAHGAKVANEVRKARLEKEPITFQEAIARAEGKEIQSPEPIPDEQGGVGVMPEFVQEDESGNKVDEIRANSEAEAEQYKNEDPKYQEAVDVVIKEGQASISMVQRRLRIGYNRAAQLIESMERDGIVGPADGASPRKSVNAAQPQLEEEQKPVAEPQEEVSTEVAEEQDTLESTEQENLEPDGSKLKKAEPVTETPVDNTPDVTEQKDAKPQSYPIPQNQADYAAHREAQRGTIRQDTDKTPDPQREAGPAHEEEIQDVPDGAKEEVKGDSGQREVAVERKDYHAKSSALAASKTASAKDSENTSREPDRKKSSLSSASKTGVQYSVTGQGESVTITNGDSGVSPAEKSNRPSSSIQKKRKLTLTEKEKYINKSGFRNASEKRLRKKKKKRNVENLYADIKIIEAGQEKYKKDKELEKTKKHLWYPHFSSREVLEENGYKVVATNTTDFDGNLSTSDYYEHPETNTRVRVSDHPPQYARSYRNEIFIHPGSFENDFSAINAISDGAKNRPTKTAGAIEYNELNSTPDSAKSEPTKASVSQSDESDTHGAPAQNVTDAKPETTTIRDILTEAKSSKQEGLTGQLVGFLDSFIPGSKLDGKVEINPNIDFPQYNQRTNTITLQNRESTVTSIHEIAHAVTANEIESNPRIKKNLIRLMNKVKVEAIKRNILPPEIIGKLEEARTSAAFVRQFSDGSVAGLNGLAYGLLNEKEFIAQAFSNKQFQDFLKRVKVVDKGKIRKAWDAFVEMVMKSLGIDKTHETAFGEVLKITAQLAQSETSNTEEGVHGSITENYDERNPPPIAGTVKDDVYTQVFKANKDIKRQAVRNTKSFFGKVVGGLDKFLGASSTRLKNINPKLEAKVRELDFNIGTKSTGDVRTVEKLLKKAKKMTREDFSAWDYARKNGDKVKIDELVTKYGLENEYAEYRTVLDNIRDEANHVGLAVGYLKEYAPRTINDAQGFLNELGRGDDWPVIEQRLKAYAKKHEITVAQITLEQKADIISNMLFSGGGFVGRPGGAKERTIKKIPVKLNQYYMDSDAALMHYLHNMRKHIEIRNFFGKLPETIAQAKRNMRSAMTRKRVAEKDGRTADAARIQETITEYRNILDKYRDQRDYTDNIGTYIAELLINGDIDETQQQTVIDVLQARFHEVGTRGVIQAYKNLSYIDTMGSPISALTQIGDLAWTIYENGLTRSLKHAYKSARGKVRITKEDVGIERIAQEFADSETLSKAVALTFKYVGLEKMDTIGKESFLNSALEKFEAMAVKDPAKLKREIEHIFEFDSDAVIDDLQNKEITGNVKLLVYSKLLDYQPAALSEMPEQYLKAGNGRLFYMLKSYTLKQFDVFRRESYNKIKNGDAKEKVQGVKNLIMLGSIIALANGGADEIKDFFLGRETSLEDRVVDNILRLFGISKYVTWKARTEGVGTALVKQILPPFKFIDSTTRDVVTAGDGKGLKITQSIPVVGKLAYWHMGPGKDNQRDLWEIRFSREKKRLNRIKDKTEENPESRTKYRTELRKLRTLNRIQGRANKLRKAINKLKAAEKKTGRNYDVRIKKLEKGRIALMKRYLKKSYE